VVRGGEQYLHETLTQLIVYSADHASIQYSQSASGHHHDITRVRIRMIEPIAKDHLGENPSDVASKRFVVNASAMQLHYIPHARSFEQLHCQDAASAQFRVWLGKDYGMVGGEVLAEPLKVKQLATEIQFTQESLTELLHHRDRLVAFQFFLPLGNGGKAGHDVEIAADCAFYAGMLHFDNYQRPAAQPTAVNLSYRRRSHRLAIEVLKALIDWSSEFLLDRGDCYIGRVGRCAALQVRQLVRELRPNQIGTAAQDLSQLDKCRAKIGQRHPNADGERLIGKNVAGVAREHLAGGFPLGTFQSLRQPVLD
jgi:hypothetical protein